jgi:transcriptional regulator with XRE-family HTH domain
MPRRMPSSPYARLKPDWRVILKTLLAGRSMRSVSRAAALNAGAVSEWLNPAKEKEPSFQALAQVAGVLGVSLDMFVDGHPENQTATLAPALISYVKLVGVVQAGIWQEPNMFDLEERQDIPIIPKADYAGLNQYAWRVVGASLNRVAQDGEYVIGISFYDLGRDPRDGELVICERRRGATVETTAKRVRLVSGRFQLVPDSTDPRFQEPVWLSEHGQDGDEVTATHLLIGKYAPF